MQDLPFTWRKCWNHWTVFSIIWQCTSQGGEWSCWFLANLAYFRVVQLLGIVTVEVLMALWINEMDVGWILETEEESWMISIKQYLLKETLPNRRNEWRKLLRKVVLWFIMQWVLYRSGFSMSLLRYIFKEETKNILAYVHKKSCDHHTGGRRYQIRFFAVDAFD